MQNACVNFVKEVRCGSLSAATLSRALVRVDKVLKPADRPANRWFGFGADDDVGASVHFNRESFRSSPLHLGPVVLPALGASPATVSRGAWLYGAVVMQRDFRGSCTLRAAVQGDQLQALLANLHRSSQALWKLRGRLVVQWPSGEPDEALLLCGLLLKGDLATAIALAATPSSSSSSSKRPANRLPHIHQPVDRFVLALSIFVNVPALYQRFHALVMARAANIDPEVLARVRRVISPAIPRAFVKEERRRHVVRVRRRPRVTDAGAEDSGSDWSC
jgi:hypothetical protein